MKAASVKITAVEDNKWCAVATVTSDGESITDQATHANPQQAACAAVHIAAREFCASLAKNVQVTGVVNVT